jgi:hypothetical protein
MENTENTQTESTQEILSLTVIEQALERENITKQIIAKLKSDYSGLTINGIDDVDGFNKVEDARKHCKVVRVTAVKICESGREKAIQEQKDWIAKQKEVVGEVEEIENTLKAKAQFIKEEKERILFEAAQREKLPARKEKFLTIGITLEDAELLKLDDFNFTALFNEFYVKHLEEIAAKAKDDADKAAKVEAERLEAERKLSEEKAEKERAEAQRLAEEKAKAQQIENDRLKKEKEEIERKAKEAKDKADAELAKQKAEADRVAAEIKLKADKALAEEKRLAKEESDRQAEIIRKQQEENARLAKEAKDKADAELAAQQKAKAEQEEKERERLAEEKRAAIAPDKDKLKNYVSTFVTVKVEFELTSEEAKLVKQNIEDKFTAFKNWALTEIEKIK